MARPAAAAGVKKSAATAPAKRAVAKPNGTKKAAATTKRTESAASEKPVKSKAKRQLEEDDDNDEDEEEKVAPPRAKKQKQTHKRAAPAPTTASKSAAPPTINKRPTQTLDIFVFGDGSFGELGLGNKKIGKDSPSNVKLPRLNHKLPAKEVGVVQVACGGMHAIALTKDNKVLTWGVNDEKALGRETNWDGEEEDDDDDAGLDPTESNPGEVDLSAWSKTHQFVQVAATNSASFVLTDVGTVLGWGTFRDSNGVFGFSEDVMLQVTPIKVSGLSNITALAAGSNHMLALDKSGAIFTWGSGDQYQLGRKPVSRHNGPRATLLPAVCGRFTKAHHAVQIAAGSYHSFYIDNHKRVWSWGLNNFAQTGHIDAGGKDNAIVPSPKIVQSLKDRDIVHIDGGEHHSVACSANGEALTWGRLDSHQLGLAVTSFTEDNTIFDEGDRPRILFEPTVIPDLTASFVVSCSDTNIAVSPKGEAYGWGFSSNRQTGLGTREDVEVPKLIQSPDVDGKKLVWAGLGGQYGMVAAVHQS
ncbi:Uu.00g098980.m01.CDS01 [Anthostomella pinea]|uniref:Uu.00g098980.m01.CDS01 n=1 Tax=Anthostomella pinea TaxID=933095 RepID=A0AAI8VCQ1_9PEZI|nr:Uu.00g098980.m01.CDS01 [Anthostomella pinea]